MINWFSLLPSRSGNVSCFSVCVCSVGLLCFPSLESLISVIVLPSSTIGSTSLLPTAACEWEDESVSWINYSFDWKWMWWWIEYSFVRSIMPPKSWFLIQHHSSFDGCKKERLKRTLLSDVIRRNKQHVTAAGPFASNIFYHDVNPCEWRVRKLLHLSCHFVFITELMVAGCSLECTLPFSSTAVHVPFPEITPRESQKFLFLRPR